ncbi:hypothetical protein AB0L06_35195 [Spirillospora sp. NPDC052269]
MKAENPDWLKHERATCAKVPRRSFASSSNARHAIASPAAHGDGEDDVE